MGPSYRECTSCHAGMKFKNHIGPGECVQGPYSQQLTCARGTSIKDGWCQGTLKPGYYCDD